MDLTANMTLSGAGDEEILRKGGRIEGWSQEERGMEGESIALGNI